jgi:hypothetical protein
MSSVHPATATRNLSFSDLKPWATNRQVGSFFILTFIISWSLWLLAYLIGENIFGAVPFVVGAFGPMISAALISR